MKPILFIWIPKAAGTSIWEALKSAVGDGNSQYLRIAGGDKFDPTRQLTTFLHSSIAALMEHGTVTPAWIKSRYIIASRRNSWDRLVSLYHYFRRHVTLKLRLGTFSDFVGRLSKEGVPPIALYNYRGYSQANSQTSWLDEIHLNFVARFENLQEDWKDLCKQLKIDQALPHLNKSEHGPYREYYTMALRKAVAKVYRSEIEKYDYEF